MRTDPAKRSGLRLVRVTVNKGTDSLELRVAVGGGLTREWPCPLAANVSLDAHAPCEKSRFTISKDTDSV